ncbi:MAG: iron-sulfur cluster insertion protein ErpA [Nitrospirae bacterium]|nr:iron-sulfur cluster insertion protein ErpA [Nitrospirota bacterium]MBI3393293.1 iron-sulfur cluster insertion protein ErpA [Nitrospirota bacterium]
MITVTDRAIEELKVLQKEEGKEGYGLRMTVVGGGCSGFQYNMGFDEAPEANDLVIETGNLKLFVDPQSVSYLRGVEIDFVEGLGGGFKIQNPNAKHTCGCGSSFEA